MHHPPMDRRALLRRATSDQHQALDTLVSSLDLKCRTHYCQYLLANAAPLIGLELALEASGVETMLSDWGPRRRRFALAQDLHALELYADPADVPRNLSTDAMFGILYVLEGSRLGAQTLLPLVSRSTDQSVLAARQFLGANDPSLWVKFLRVLDAANVEHEEMIEAARWTFGLFSTAFAAYCAPSQRAPAPSGAYA